MVPLVNCTNLEVNHISKSVPVTVELQIGLQSHSLSALVDDGADLSIVGEHQLNGLFISDDRKVNSDLKITLADGQMTSIVLFGFYCDVILYTEAGPLVPRKQCLFVVQGSLPQVILGRPFLTHLGIDVDRQLCGLAAGGCELHQVPPEDFHASRIIQNIQP